MKLRLKLPEVGDGQRTNDKTHTPLTTYSYSHAGHHSLSCHHEFGKRFEWSTSSELLIINPKRAFPLSRNALGRKTSKLHFQIENIPKVDGVYKRPLVNVAQAEFNTDLTNMTASQTARIETVISVHLIPRIRTKHVQLG